MRQFWAFTVISTCLLTLACAKNDKSKARPPEPCAVGVNEKSCQLPIVETTRWKRTYDVTNKDPKSGMTVVENQVTVINEFAQLADGQQVWRRTSTTTTPYQYSRTMVVEGQVKKIDNKTLKLTVDQSSCDDLDQSFRINAGAEADGTREMFYRRYGSNVEFRLRPFVEVTVTQNSKGLGGVFQAMFTAPIAAMTAGIADAMAGMFGVITEVATTAFTFGLLRDQLKQGVGSFKLMTTAEAKEFSYGTIGCYVAKKADEPEKFMASKKQHLDW